jgi:hypothetical protein
MKDIVAAVRQVIPDVSTTPPDAVCEHVLGAPWQAEAKIIERKFNAPTEELKSSRLDC